MEPRLIVAWTLIALLALSAAGVILLLRYTARSATLARRRRRERKIHQQAMSEHERGKN